MSKNLRLEVYIVDENDPNPNHKIKIDLAPIVEQRIIQEEIWAQTFWPDNEISLEDTLKVWKSIDDHGDAGDALH